MYKEYLQKLENLKGKELKSERIELGAIDDLDDRIKKLSSSVMPLKNRAIEISKEISEITKKLLDASQDAKKLKGMAKELGADSVQKQAELFEKISAGRSKDWSKAADKISNGAKSI